MSPTATEVKLPTFRKVATPQPATKQRQPNPYDVLIDELAKEADASAQGCSTGRSADIRTADLAKLHESMIRRAARNHDPVVGISVIRTPIPDTDKVNITFAVIPKRVVNRKSGKVESPETGVEGPAPLAAAS